MDDDTRWSGGEKPPDDEDWVFDFGSLVGGSADERREPVRPADDAAPYDPGPTDFGPPSPAAVPPRAERRSDTYYRLPQEEPSEPAEPSSVRQAKPRPRGRGRDRDGRRLSPAGHILLAILVGFVLALLLNAQSLKRTAEAMRFGTKRTVVVHVVSPIASVSHFFLLDRPASYADKLLGKDDTSGEAAIETAQHDLGGPTSKPTPKATKSGGEVSPSPTSTALVTPTKQQPLRIWVGGDSQMQVLGQDLVDKMRRTGVMKSTLDYRISTGLSRPDYFNWPQHLKSLMNDVQPDVVVVMFGANDGQDVEYPMGSGKVLKFGTAGWLKLYRQRVGDAMDIVLRDGQTRVYWIGQPITGLSDFNPRLQAMNKVYEQEAAKRQNIVFIPLWDLFKNSSGQYSDYLKGDSGKLELMRQSDKIHLSLSGGDRAGDAVLDRIKQDYHLQ